LFIAAVADEGSPLEPGAGFFLKVFADLVALEAGTALAVTGKEFLADIGPLAAEAVDTEVLRIIEASLVPCIETAVEPYLFGDRSGILAEVAADIPERKTGGKGIGNEDPVL